ncbi:MAG: tetratricopeptide repeat protein, partial [Leptospirales bacterium]
CGIGLLKLENPKIELIINILDSIDKYGSEYSEPKLLLVDYLTKATASGSEKAENIGILTGVLHENTAEGSMEKVFARFENSAGDEKKEHQNTLLVFFHILGAHSALAMEYRKKLSRALN